MTPAAGDPHALATSYLSPSTDSLWRWSSDGEVLTWSDGATIAFRQEVEAVLARLAPQGLPPFGAVAMLLAACRDGWDRSPGRDAFLRYATVFGQWRGGAGFTPGGSASQLVFQRVARGIEDVVKGLDAVSGFAPDVRQSTEAKATLAEAVFEGSKANRLSPEESGQVVRAMADGISAERLTLRFSSSEALREFAGDADALREGLPRVGEKSLALRKTTGLDELPRPPDLDLAPGERVRRLLAELRGDKDLAGLARLAQDLMAAVHVPRTLREQEELPLGGVSDLSNRGPLDRLLVSELAHDDVTLAVRVAVNEALYLRRESPPRNPPHRRAILIDSGVRMWGVPRVFGTAAALAMAATADPHAELLVFRAAGGGIEPVDLTTRAGLVACLEALDAAPHPGAAVGSFLAEAGGASAAPTDAIVVTHPDVLTDRDFGAALRRLDDPALYVATVDRDGAFALAALTRAGRKPLRDARLSLDALLGEGPAEPRAAGLTGHRLVVKDVDPDLPAILSAEPFPLRLPHVADPKLARASKRHGLVGLTHDGRLLHWDHPKFAARQLTALLPAGRPRGIWLDDEAARAHVLFDHTRGARCRLITADLATAQATVAPVPAKAQGALSAFVRGGVLFLVFRQKHRSHAYEVECFDLGTGAPAGTLPVKGVELLRDRFFRGRDGWHALAYAGAGPVLTALTFPAASHDSPVIGLFDRAGHDGPWAVLSDGRVVDSLGTVFPRRFPKLPVRWKFVCVSADGNRVAVGAFHNFLMDLSADEDPKPVTADVAEELLVPHVYWSTRFSPLVRKDFTAAFLISGEIALATPKDELVLIETSAGAGPRVNPLAVRASSVLGALPFQAVTPPRGVRFELWAARWKDGSRMFLDSRGMLHLKSSDRSIPEVSLVVAGDRLAGWSTTGRSFGPLQFIGGGAPGTPPEFASLIERFVAKLRYE